MADAANSDAPTITAPTTVPQTDDDGTIVVAKNPALQKKATSSTDAGL